jgi:hypothetical protein
MPTNLSCALLRSLLLKPANQILIKFHETIQLLGLDLDSAFLSQMTQIGCNQ